ncbi:sn-glycerol-3-phosphate ABC transporter ATP-binding protein UgpC [Devosia sp. BK]|uniref:ABC transporter ATP-binding protein n=1 Tax=Devosia sp. BK TaxID=2871706 RepID=UPI00293A6BCE|nr:sn-glycerol-3-phosphate ABC transporter ATP-binding protein UgpC [Devosia sp. BK]MDV3250410.1 sn-glycerol-3-phosphate ABC transporter ATP-binding protein UgpC [Devosia sp. BK]
MTAQIELKNIEKHYGSFHALKNVSLTIDKGSFVALVGPSGCGKSTLLRSIAGLETISSGELSIAGKTMTGVPPRHRDIAMVFQSYALYPHMTVEENLTYSLRLHGVGKAESKAKAAEVAQTTGLGQLLPRYPRQLSGGQRQRVAMGRAIIRNPKAFLFDEPLSNLDAALRVQMRKEIRALHDRLGATSVYVTHDQIEAMTMADWVVVMRDGIIEQQGRPLDLYDHPVNRFVAGFIGSPAMNFIEGKIASDGRAVNLVGGERIPLARQAEPNQPVVAGLRPEHMKLATGTPTFHFPVGNVESTGSATYLTSADGHLQLVQSERSTVSVGDRVGVEIDPALIHLFDPQSGKRI